MKNITSWKTICIHNENLISNYEELLEMIGRSITPQKKKKDNTNKQFTEKEIQMIIKHMKDNQPNL